MKGTGKAGKTVRGEKGETRKIFTKDESIDMDTSAEGGGAVDGGAAGKEAGMTQAEKDAISAAQVCSPMFTYLCSPAIDI